ncbi:MAG: transporter substrate-binding domain-containing protein [Roseovarius sp.]|nr:transporter substrate-binding domain-containing protein [Roseovarius sp.]
MINTIAGGMMAAIGFFSTAATAQTCGGVYTVERGDSLSTIADSLYKDAGMWTAIHNANLSKIGESPDAIHAGMILRLACINGRPLGLSGGTEARHTPPTTRATAPIVQVAGPAASRAKVNLLTAGDFAPFTDRTLPNGGLLADVVNAAMAKAAPAQGYAIHWVEDRPSHLEPLLSNTLLDAGFPWYRPDCAAQPDMSFCENFLFSDAIFEILILLFTDKARPLAFDSDDDLIGKRLCRPAGYFTHDLDRAGRRWLSEGKVTLEQPRSVAECFALLVQGKVDAVAINEFTGRTALKEMNIKAQVEIVQTRPLSIQGMHLVVHKTHPHGGEIIALFNQGLAGIKADASYQLIMESHMTRIWAGF